jgi:hypothetical protein
MNAKVFLVLSLILNVALGAMLLKPSSSPPPPAAGRGDPEKAVPVALPPAVPAAKPRTVTQVVTNTVAQKFDWSSVESDDYKKYIANLRAIGCPEETIRDIIKADVNKLYESKRKELAGPPKKFEFWKANALMTAVADPERTEKERALNKEKRALLTELLGSAPEETPDLLASAAGQMEAMFGFLPAEKRNKVFEVLQDMQGKMQKAMKSGAPDPEDIRKAQKESEAALAAILTPQELLNYNLRLSQTANMMRFTLAGFEPNEQEFLDVFKMRKAFDDEFGGPGMGGLNLKGEEKQKHDAAKKALDEQIKARLGDERYSDYQRAQDGAFQAMYRVADREGLGKEAAVKTFEMKKAAEAQAKKLREDQALSADQRTAALRAIREETERSVKGVLGEKGFTSLERNNGAWWLRNLAPDAPSPTTTKQP